MPFKQAFGAAALPVAGASAVAIAAAIGYFVYTGTPSSSSDPVSQAVADVTAQTTPAGLAPSETASAKAVPDQKNMPTVDDTNSAVAAASTPESVETSTMPVLDPAATVPSATAEVLAIDQGTEQRTEPQQVVQGSDPDPEAAAPTAETPKLSAPTVDIVRIPPTGISTVAGRADPDADILIFVDGVEVARAKAGAGGEYVALFDIPSVERPREMQIAAEKDDTRVFAGSSIIIAPFIAGPVSDPAASAPDIMVAKADPDKTDVPGDTIASGLADASVATDEGGETPNVADDLTPNVEEGQPIDVAKSEQAIDAQASQLTTEATAKPVVAVLAPKANAPTVMVADDSGVKIVQSAAPIQGVSIDAITYDPDGAVFASGRGTAGATVRLYLSNTPLMDTPIGADGQWRAKMDVDAGIFSLRADMVDEAGKVLGRVEIPFKREDIAVLTRLAQRASENTPADSAQSATATQPNAANDSSNAAAEIATGGTETSAEPAPLARIASITVQPGNTLWGIASDTYGDGFLYARVFNANVAQIRDPDLIYPGQVFELPPN